MPANAILVPSGDHAGSALARAGALVRLVTPVPSAFINRSRCSTLGSTEACARRRVTRSCEILARFVRQSLLVPAVRVHHVDLVVAVSVADEGDPGAVRRPRRKVAPTRSTVSVRMLEPSASIEAISVSPLRPAS